MQTADKWRVRDVTRHRQAIAIHRLLTHDVAITGALTLARPHLLRTYHDRRATMWRYYREDTHSHGAVWSPGNDSA
jgi:hypothetical protein